MSGFDSSSSTFSFNSTFADTPVIVEYEVEVNEDHRGQDAVVIPTACVIGDHAVDLCEDAGFFHPEQLRVDALIRDHEAACVAKEADDPACPPCEYGHRCLRGGGCPVREREARHG
jgi:hypothetical protein